MSIRKTILILAFTDLARDPRIRRQITFLKERYLVLAAASGSPGDADVEYISLAPWLRRNRGVIRRSLHLLGRLTGWFGLTHAGDGVLTRELADFVRRPIDLIIANDVETMLLASVLSKTCGAPILLDAHEMEPWHRRALSPGERPPNVQSWFCSTYIPLAQRMLSVSGAIADHYAKTYGVACDVVTNAPFYNDLLPRPCCEAAVRLVHHGGTNATRGLDNMFLLLDRLDIRFTLDLYLVPNNPKQYERLQKLVAASPRARLHPPVAVEKISETLNQYDLGIYMLNPDTANQKYSLPNKLFEFIQARLGVAIWPSPEMVRIVKDHGLGVIAEEFSVESMAKALNALSKSDIDRLKQASHAAARTLSAETNQSMALRIVEQMLNEPERKREVQ